MFNISKGKISHFLQICGSESRRQCVKYSCETRADMAKRLSNSEIRLKRNTLFENELKRQKNLIPRLEKIQVEFLPRSEEEGKTLIMNKDMSTPFNVAQHLHEDIVRKSALALVNDQLWDMNRPLTEDCTLKFLHFQMEDEDTYQINRAFWRSCSFMLGDALENLFQDQYLIQLHSFPSPNVKSGSFVHDVDLSFTEWNPTKTELMAFSAYLHRLAEKEIPFERLIVDASVALEIFAENPYKIKQIPSIASNSETGNSVSLYRMGDHVDISRGPMVGNTGFLGRRCTITSAHPIEHDGIPMFRFQGVALPKGMFLDSFAYGILEKRASLINPAGRKSINPS